MSKSMTREEWNQKYAEAFHKISQCKMAFCLESAANSDDYFNDGYKPDEAAHEEYSYWEPDC